MTSTNQPPDPDDLPVDPNNPVPNDPDDTDSTDADQDDQSSSTDTIRERVEERVEEHEDIGSGNDDSGSRSG